MRDWRHSAPKCSPMFQSRGVGVESVVFLDDSMHGIALLIPVPVQDRCILDKLVNVLCYRVAYSPAPTISTVVDCIFQQ